MARNVKFKPPLAEETKIKSVLPEEYEFWNTKTDEQQDSEAFTRFEDIAKVSGLYIEHADATFDLGTPIISKTKPALPAHFSDRPAQLGLDSS